MKLTNEKNLPDVFLRAIKKNERPLGGEDTISVTTLIAQPQAVQLRREHFDKIEEDASKMLFSLDGTLMHLLLERASDIDSDDVLEETLSSNEFKLRLVGTPDLISEGVLYDYKNTSVFHIKGLLQDKDIKDEWLWQTNIYRYLFGCEKIKGIRIIAIARDWRQREYDRMKGDGYPEKVTTFDIPVLPEKEVKTEIERRIELHYNERNGIDHYECTDEERWATPTIYAVKKAGAKRALKLYENLKDAQVHYKALADKADGKKAEAYLIEERPPKYTRCESYCSASPYCNQWKATQEKGES
tara:strand:+ start:1069 stop:1968 length:900 start_codon:yes stop_codon:yes gene_type:complete